MKSIHLSTRLAWLRLCFLLSPEDSSAGHVSLPPWATACCLKIKAVLWLTVSVAMALLVGQL